MRSASEVDSSLHCDMRKQQLDKLCEAELDVLVIGGGITGVGAALDAVARGFKVGIIEARDWSIGTSSRSSKMIHGGLRYLATGDISVVRESLHERKLIQRNAKHLVRPLSMLLPVYSRSRYSYTRMKLSVGMWAYELLGHKAAAGGLHEWLDKSQILNLVPNLLQEDPGSGYSLQGGFHYHDDSADDCRLVIAVLRKAVHLGAVAVNGVRAKHLIYDSANNKVCGAVVESDLYEQQEAQIRAKVVINATGVWADEVLAGAGKAEEDIEVLPSKGIHLAVSTQKAGINSGIAFFEQNGNANVFIEPWQDGIAFLGTTDAPYSGDLSSPKADENEIAWVLEHASKYLRVPLERTDVIASWAGLRPLVKSNKYSGKKASKDISRRHLLVERSGVITISGGKLTTYRAMAEDAVDAACKQLGSKVKCATKMTEVDGCREPRSDIELEKFVHEDIEMLSISQLRHLDRRYGSNLEKVLHLIECNPSLAERIHSDRPYIMAEVVWAFENEQARTAEDILERRTRISLEAANLDEAKRRIEEVLFNV